MIRSLKRALQPAVTEVSLEFQVGPEYTVIQSHQKLPPIFNEDKLTAYAIFQPKSATSVSQGTAILKANLAGVEKEYKIPFTIDGSVPAPSLPVIHHLAAKALITGWEIEGKEKKSIVDLSIESSVISSHTAFIAIDEESSEPVSGALKTHDIRSGWRGSNSNSLYISECEYDCECVHAHPMPLSLPLALYIPPPLPPPLPPPRSKSLCAGAAPVPLSLPDIPPPLPPPRSKRLCEGELEYELESWSEGEGQERVLEQRKEKKEKQKAADRDTGLNTLTNLITAQKVDGSWALTSSFAQLVGKSLSDLEAVCPIERKGAGATVWATVLAVSLLRARYSSHQEEWELIAMKAESWLKKQTLPSGYTLEQLFQAAQKQIMCLHKVD